MASVDVPGIDHHLGRVHAADSFLDPTPDAGIGGGPMWADHGEELVRAER